MNTTVTGTWVERLIENNVNIRRGFGIVLVHRSHQALVPTLHSALAQAGFRDLIRSVVWLKQMRDGTQRALVIHLYDHDSVKTPEYVLRRAKNIFIIAEGSQSLVAPVLVNSVTDADPSTMKSPIAFNVPLDANDSSMMCDHVFTVSSRDMQEFTPPLQRAIEGTRDVWCYSKYVMLITPQHEYQLGMILESITNAFETLVTKRILIYKLKKDFPDTVPLVAPLHRIGLEGEVLLKVDNGHFVYYYVLLHALTFVVSDMFPFYMFAHVAPWYRGYFNVCWLFTFRMHHHPNNAHVKDDTRELMKRIEMGIHGSKREWCFSGRCCHDKLFN